MKKYKNKYIQLDTGAFKLTVNTMAPHSEAKKKKIPITGTGLVPVGIIPVVMSLPLVHSS